jgi:hypothetical protein
MTSLIRKLCVGPSIVCACVPHHWLPWTFLDCLSDIQQRRFHSTLRIGVVREAYSIVKIALRVTSFRAETMIS